MINNEMDHGEIKTGIAQHGTVNGYVFCFEIENGLLARNMGRTHDMAGVSKNFLFLFTYTIPKYVRY